MAYLDPRSRFRIPGAVRRLLDGKPGETRWQDTVFTDVGRFLADNTLDPTPENYDLAYQIHASGNTRLKAAVEAEIAATGRLDSDAVERIVAETCVTLGVDTVARMAKAVEDQAVGLTSIARQSKHDARSFQTALEASRNFGTHEHVLELTTRMATRAHDAEMRLRAVETELTGLRSTLAEAQRVADVDPLTELPNRRAFKRDLEAAIERASNKGTALSLAFCDIDHFKRVNDTHGHETGDRVLRFVAALLAKTFEGSGCVGRFGGEEFVIMMPTAIGDARDAVDACRAQLAERHLYAATDGASIGTITFSAGVTTLGHGDGTAELLRRADDALYRAQNDGRDRVVVG